MQVVPQMDVALGSSEQALADAAFKLRPGDLAGPVRTRVGWMVLRLDDRKDADVKPFEQVAEQVERELVARARQEARDAILRELRSAAAIRIVAEL